MKKCGIILVVLIMMVSLCGCIGGEVENLIDDYYAEKLSDADSYSFKIKSKTNINNDDFDYDDIIKYTRIRRD